VIAGCPACAAPLDGDAALTCTTCGVPLGGHCPACGAVNLPRAQFCAGCGARLGAARPSSTGAAATHPAEAERRQLTVLFCDLVGSAELAGRLDPEELRDVIRAYQQVAAAVVARFEGHVAQYLGDGLLVYFGYPIAHEDDPRRAAQAALSMLEAFQRFSFRLQGRIGIHTGLVVAGEIGVGGHVEQLALGDTPNIAARLQELAEPDTVVVSAATQALIDGYFVCLDLGPQTARGLARPLSLWRVVRESSARSRLDVAAASGLSPLIGRDREVETLADAWAAAVRGDGRTVLIGGEPGIGKSRLVRMLEEHAARDPGTWLTACLCSPYYRNTAFYPIVDLLERVTLRFEAGTPSSQKRDRLEGWLTQYGLARPDVLPLFAALLSIPLDDQYPPPSTPPERQKLDLMGHLVDIFFARAPRQPMLFVLEDAHWADPSTLELFERMLQRAPTACFLGVVTFRPEFAPPWPAVAHQTRLNLSRLGPAQAAELVARVSADRVLPVDVVREVVVRADGVPLFVEELTKTVLQWGAGSWQQAAGVPSDPPPRWRSQPLAIPTTLHDSLMARLDRLQPVKSIAQLAATLGREFSFELLAAVAWVDEPTLRGALDELVAAELLFRRSSATGESYAFKHALIQEAAYQALLRSTRKHYHQQVARTLEERFPAVAEAQPELVARHYTRASMPERAIPHWQRAGQRALSQAANLEAIAHLTRAIDLVQLLPASPERDHQELALQIELAPAYMAIKGWASAEVEATCRRSHALSKTLNDARGVYASLWGLWTNAFLRCQLDRALALAHDVSRLAAASENRVLQLTARHAVGYSHFYRGEFELAREHAEAGLALFDLDAERAIVRSFQFSSSAALRMMLGCSLWMLGRVDEGARLVDGAVELTRQLAHRPSEAYALGTSLLFHYYRDDVERAEATAADLFALSREESFEMWNPFAVIFTGWAMVEHGAAAAGIGEIRRGLATWQATGTAVSQTIAVAMLGECLRRARRSEEAMQLLEQEIPAALQRKEGHYLSELYRLKGHIAWEMTGDTASAEQLFRTACGQARSAGARMLELRATVSLGQLWEETGRFDQVAEPIGRLLHLLPNGHGSRDVAQARVLRDRAIASTAGAGGSV
jgi:class 3 adenylate cyclase/tetratricopeptide (TPR) repeat protein